MGYSIVDLESKYDLELKELVSRIGKLGVGSVLVQLPDGLKPFGVAICDYLSERCDCEIRIWLGSCFGACDLPAPSVQSEVGSRKSEDVLVVQFGHAEW